MTIARGRIAGVVVALALMATACGGADEPALVDAGPSPTPLPTFSAEPTAIPETDQLLDQDAAPDPPEVRPDRTPDEVEPAGTPTPLPTPTPPAGDGDEPDPAEGDADTDGGDSGTTDAEAHPFCVADDDLVLALDALDAVDDENFGDTFALASQTFAAWVDAAPDELADAVDSFAASWAEIELAHVDADGDRAATGDALTDWYFSKGFEQAANAIDDWSVANCPA